MGGEVDHAGVFLRLLHAPLSLLEMIWNIIFSPVGFVIGLWLWWQADFVVPDFKGLFSWMTSWMQGNWFPWAIGIAGSCYVILRIARYWINRPRVQTVVQERVVYKDPPPPPSPPPPHEVLNERYKRTMQIVQTLVFLEPDEQKAAARKSKNKLLKELEDML